MLHEKSLLSYLLAVVAMATVGCDDDTVNHDVFTKADGTLNLCGTFDANETIVEKGDVVKNVRVINSERYEYTCAQFDENNSKCLGIERKICKNDNFDDACKDETLANDGLLARLRMLALNDDRRHDDAEPHRARNGHRHDLAPLRRQNVDLIPAFERLKRPYCSQTTHQYADDGT